VSEPSRTPELGPGILAAYALVLLLTVLTTVWGAFLVPLRVGTVPVPVSVVVAVVGNLALGIAGARVVGRWVGAVLPGLLWLALALVLGSKRSEGDLVVPAGAVGLAYLVLGAVAATAAVVLAQPRRTRT
jgi:Family of unknown function (DUF6113)